MYGRYGDEPTELWMEQEIQRQEQKMNEIFIEWMSRCH